VIRITKEGDFTHGLQSPLRGKIYMHGSAMTLAVKKWRYRPFLLNGEPVEVETTSTVNFRIH